MSSNVVKLPLSASRPSHSAPDTAAALAGLAASVAEIGQMQFDSKADMQEAIFLLGLSNARARQLICQIRDDESRMRLLAHSDRIRELVEIAGRKAAAL